MLNQALFTGDLLPVAPFDFAKSLQFLGEFKPVRSEQLIASGKLTKAVCMDGQAVVFRLWATGTVEKPQLHYEIYAAAASVNLQAKILAQILDRITFFLSLNENLQPFYALAAQDQKFAPIVQQLYGYHQVKFLTLFENGCWAILTQRTPMTVAAKMKQALVERFGRQLVVQGEPFWAFPTPAELAQSSVEELQAAIGHRQKAEYLRNVITAFDSVDEEWLRTGASEEVQRWLLGIRGFGPFSAAFVMIRGLGRVDGALPAMQQFNSAVEKVYNNGQPLAPSAIQHIAAQYGEWQGYWMHYLRAAG